MTPAGEARPQGSTRKVEPTSPTPEDRVRLELLTCGTTEGRSVRCGDVERASEGMRAACGCGARAARRDSRVCGRRSDPAAGRGSSGERTCSGEHVEREQQQLAFLLFSCGQNALQKCSSFGSVSACPPAARAAAGSSINSSSAAVGACERARQAGDGAVDRAAARARRELRVHAGELLTAFGELRRRRRELPPLLRRRACCKRRATAPHRTAWRSRGGGANCT